MIKGKTEEKRVFKLYTGLCDVNVISFNPDFETLKEYFGGSDKTKEPVYSKEVDVKDKSGAVIGHCNQLRLDIWVANEEHVIKCKSSIFLEDRLRPESATTPGNYQWINDVGQTIWMNEQHSNLSDKQQKFFDVSKNPRRAYVGEETLYHFLQRWSQIDQKAEDSVLKLDTDWSDLVNGDVSELNSYVQQLEGNQVRVLFGVQDSKYQNFFTGHFLKAGDTYIEKLKDQVSEKKWKCNYQNSFELKVFDMTKDMPVSSNIEQASEEDVKIALNV